MDNQILKVIAEIHNSYSEKFGIPRQSGMINSVVSKIVFKREYSDINALRGIDGFSHLWLIWGFSKADKSDWSPTVRPPRLGGNKRLGVFATRSPYRPNKIGLSSVKLIKSDFENGRNVLYVTGADILDGTPIFDIKPYLKFTDCHTDAVSGFADKTYGYKLNVVFLPETKEKINPLNLNSVTEIIAADPRPSYIEDDGRVYGISFGGQNIKFTVSGNTASIIEVF